jgi:hypothetical protein
MREKVDGGWYTAEIVEVRQEDGQLIVTLDESTYTVNRRDPRYWWYCLRAVGSWVRHGGRWVD